MKKRDLVDILGSFVDDLVTGNLSEADYLSDFAGEEEVIELLELTDRISAILVPVEPSAEFVQRLGTSLAAAAAPASTEIIIGRSRHQKFWMGALLSGSLVSAVGVFALWWLRRSRRSAMPVA